MGGIAHYTGLLAKVTQYLPSVPSTPAFVTSALSYLPSVPSCSTPQFVSDAASAVINAPGALQNATITFSGKVAEMAAAVDGIWGVSSLIPSASTVLIGGGSFAAGVLVTYAVRKCFFNK